MTNRCFGRFIYISIIQLNFFGDTTPWSEGVFAPRSNKCLLSEHFYCFWNEDFLLERLFCKQTSYKQFADNFFWSDWMSRFILGSMSTESSHSEGSGTLIYKNIFNKNKSFVCLFETDSLKAVIKAQILNFCIWIWQRLQIRTEWFGSLRWLWNFK